MVFSQTAYGSTALTAQYYIMYIGCGYSCTSTSRTNERILCCVSNIIAGRCHGSEEVAQDNVQWANRADWLWNVRNSEDCGVHEYCLPMTYRLSF